MSRFTQSLLGVLQSKLMRLRLVYGVKTSNELRYSTYEMEEKDDALLSLMILSTSAVVSRDSKSLACWCCRYSQHRP